MTYRASTFLVKVLFQYSPIFVLPHTKAYVVDVHTLQDQAFSTSGNAGWTLSGVFESKFVQKAIFDVRNDSDVMLSQFNVRLAGMEDIQPMELATQRSSKRVVNGLSRCIKRDCPMTITGKVAWTMTEEVGLSLFAPERGGRYEVAPL